MCDCAYSVHPGIECGSERCNCHPVETLDQELSHLLNKYSAESVSGTPDFILAEYVLDCLKAYNAAVFKRAEWRGESVEFDPRPSVLLKATERDLEN